MFSTEYCWMLNAIKFVLHITTYEGDYLKALINKNIKELTE